MRLVMLGSVEAENGATALKGDVVLIVVGRLRPAELPEEVRHARQIVYGQGDEADTGRDGHELNFFRRSSFTSFGLARPSVSFITWPTKKPSSPSLPARYDSTWPGFAAST